MPSLLNTEECFRVGPYPYSWGLNSTTLIEGYPETIPPALPCKFQFAPFNDLQKYAESRDYQNIKGIVVSCLPSQEENEGSTRKNVIVVNEEKKLIILTLWDAFEDREGWTLQKMANTAPVIFGMRLKVTTFRGLSLTTRLSSAILINPPAAETQELQNWYTENEPEVRELLQEKTYKNTDLLLPYSQQEDIIPIGVAIESLRNHKVVWVKGDLSLPKQDRSFSHTACANCMKWIDADITWIVTCPSCKTQSEVKLISRATIELNDGSGTIRSVISSPDIEKFITLSPEQVRDAEEYDPDLYETIAKTISSCSAVAFLRSYQTTSNNQPTTRIVIVKAHKAKEMNREKMSPQPAIDLESRKRKQQSSQMDDATSTKKGK